MRLLLVLLAFLISTQLLAETRSATICYFSLNNPKEYRDMNKLAQELNKKTGQNITVKEYMTNNADPEIAFQKMVDSNANCDGLVISGHHTGAFGGERADGTLKIDFLEKISCDPKRKNWFKKVKALWLQGCRTLGVGVIAPEEVGDEQFSADFHTSRVNLVREDDSLEQAFSEMNHEFTNTLSQDNPLSARYLRVFPRATVFGWTRSAPGEKSHSERSLLYHIAHMANINDYLGRDVMIDPYKDFSDKDAIELADSVLDILQKPDWNHCEATSIKAWKNHGTLIKNKGYGFNNPDLNAYKSFESTNDSTMVKAKELGCKLKFPKNQAERIQVLQDILTDRKLIAANFSSIIELSSDPQAVSVMKHSSLLQAFVGDKSLSKQSGLFAKIDYYTFYKKVFAKKSIDIENTIKSQSYRVLLEAYPSDQESNSFLDLRDMKATLTSSIAKNNFADKEFILKLINSGSMGKKMAEVIYNKSKDPQIKSLRSLIRQ
jgi:hypothetical protein